MEPDYKKLYLELIDKLTKERQRKLADQAELSKNFEDFVNSQPEEK